METDKRNPFRLPSGPAERFQGFFGPSNAQSWLTLMVPFPRAPLILPDRTSPSKVHFAAFCALDCSGPIRGTALCLRGERRKPVPGLLIGSGIGEDPCLGSSPESSAKVIAA